MSARTLFCCSNSDWEVSEWSSWEREEEEAAAGGREEREVEVEGRMVEGLGEEEDENSDERTLAVTTSEDGW